MLLICTTVRHGGTIMTARPSADGAGQGYLRERLEWYHCTVSGGLVPENQDGEVEQSCVMAPDDMLQGAFTLEAALISANLLGLP
ncbi:MAG: hypothetical protein JWP47_333 [Polaromonas sp.]|jgi:hypothetical protein|nr:hypothetical protein [Polaromonas sp.]